jgi:hypothetical protein
MAQEDKLLASNHKSTLNVCFGPNPTEQLHLPQDDAMGPFADFVAKEVRVRGHYRTLRGPGIARLRAPLQ